MWVLGNRSGMFECKTEVGPKTVGEPQAREPRPDPLAGMKNAVAILVENPVNRRLIEAAAITLEMIPVVVGDQSEVLSSLAAFELILADEQVARLLRASMVVPGEDVQVINPALVAVRPQCPTPRLVVERKDADFEGVLLLPQKLAAVVAQLGLILYAQRSFARSYQGALDELHLDRCTFQCVTSGISIANVTLPDLPLVYVNPAFEAMTGYSLEEVLGKNCRFLQNDHHDQPGLTLVREALRANRETTAVVRNFRKDGSAFWNELSLSPISNREGTVTHFVGIQMDVTARVEFEAALRESEKLAAVGRLAAAIAHEINNPLESVMNLLYLAHEAEGQKVMLEYVTMADCELKRVAQITSQSLRFYRQSTRPLPIRCHDLLQAVLDVYRSRVEQREIKLEMRERMAEPIVCLESEIRQVISNLIRNAIDAMQGSPGRLLIRSRETTEWKSLKRGVMLTFADTGTGIAKDAMERLYTAFFTTKEVGGTGLGLWVSAEIVQRHQGRLRVRSSQRAGRSGTVFQLFLPYQGLA